MPDWLANKKDAGVFDTTIRGLGMVADGLDGIFKIGANLSFDMPKFMMEATENTNNFKRELVNLGMELQKVGNIWQVGNINGVDLGAGIQKADEAIANLKAKLEDLKNYKLDEIIKLEIQSDIEAQISQIQALKSQLVDAQNVQISADEAVKISNQNLLNSFLSSNDKRIEDHEKTIETMMKKEADLTAKIEAERANQDRINTNYANKAADLTLSAEEKRRKAAQTGLSEEAKFNDDRHAMIQRLFQAKEALNEKDLDSFRRYIAEAERLNDELGCL